MGLKNQSERATAARAPISAAAWRVSVLTSAATFVFVMDSGLLSIAFPKLAKEFPGTPRATLSWASTGFSVVMAACMAFAGSVADRFGRKKVYLLGLGAYAVGGAVTSIAPNVPVLISARLLEGAGAAFFVTAGLALALLAFPPERRATALGMWGIIGSLAAIVAPTVGAAVLDTWGWRWAFAGLAASAFIAFIAGFKLTADEGAHTGAGAPDPLGVVLGAAGVALIVLSISRSQLWGWIDWRTMGCLAVGLCFLPIVVRRSHHHPRPLVPPELARHRQYLLITASCVVQQVGFFSYFFSLPLILIGVWGWTSLQAGYAMAVSMAVSAVVVPIYTRWVERRGYTGLVLAGTAIVAISFLWWLITFSESPNIGWALAPGLVITGIGNSITGNFASGAALAHVPPAVMGQGNSLHQMSRRIGGSIGVALTIALIGESKEPSDLLAGAHRVWILLVVVHALMAVLYAWGSRPSRTSPRPIPSQ